MSDGGTIEPAPKTRVRLGGISSRAWEHPADRGALVALRQLRGFEFVLQKLSGLWNERALHLVYVGTGIRVDHRQYAHVHLALQQAAVALDVSDPPELFVVQDPVPRAMAIGVDTPFIVVSSGMLELLDDDELPFVLGHELGHIRSGHALYTTMLLQLLRMSTSMSWFSLGAFGLRAIIAALHEWRRKAELSGDRAGLLAVQDPAAANRVLMKIAGGGHLDDLDAAAFAQQGDEYLASGDVRDSVLKLLLLEAQSHPFAVVRAAELRRWVDGGDYVRILGGDYPTTDDEGADTIREDVNDAATHYREAFETSQDPLIGLVRGIGDVLGDTVGGVRNWVSRTFSGDSGSTDDG